MSFRTKGLRLRWVYEGYADEPAFADLDRASFVPWEGPDDPELILLGEAPGRTEAELEMPFIGRSGSRLTHYLETAGIDRSRCWVTNVVKYRPAGPGGKDRPPTDSEIRASMPYLWRELEFAAGSSCRVICALGRTAASAMLGREVIVGREHGTFRIITDPAGVRWALFITYHPAAALRNPASDTLLKADLAKLAEQVRKSGRLAAEVLA